MLERRARLVEYPPKPERDLTLEERVVMTCLFYHKEFKLDLGEICLFTKLPEPIIEQAMRELERRGNIPRQYCAVNFN